MASIYGTLKPFSFILPTEIVFGPGVVKSLPERLIAMGCRHPLIITDAGIVKAGIIARLQELCQGMPEGFALDIYDGVAANPKDHQVAEGAALYRDVGADALIAVGGGSPIDCAKAIGVLVANGASEVYPFEGKNKPSEPLPPLIAIPTTAGTGSELTFSAVITDTRRNYKMTVRNAFTAPRLAICDPELTLTVPAQITAATGMDALTHAIEAYTATTNEPISDAVALYATELIADSLVTAVNDGSNLQARSQMLMGSLLAGIAFSHSDVASVHCIAEALGGIYDLPHGTCNAVILPHIMVYSMPWCVERYARLARAMGCTTDEGEAGAQQAVSAVQRLAREVKLPLFSELKIDPADFPRIAAASFQNLSNESNPRPMSEADYLTVLQTMQVAR